MLGIIFVDLHSKVKSSFYKIPQPAVFTESKSGILLQQSLSPRRVDVMLDKGTNNKVAFKIILTKISKLNKLLLAG